MPSQLNLKGSVCRSSSSLSSCSTSRAGTPSPRAASPPAMARASGGIRQDESILREEYHSDADIHTDVLRLLLPPPIAPVDARVPARAQEQAPEVWLQHCKDGALREYAALAQSEDPLRLTVTLQRTIRPEPMHCSARILRVGASDNAQLGFLGGHLVRIDGNFYLCLGKRGLLGAELFGAEPIACVARPAVHAAKTPPKSTVARRPNAYACLSVDEDSGSSDAEEHHTADHKESVTIVEEIDLESLTVSEVTRQVREVLERLSTDEASATAGSPHKRHALFALGASVASKRVKSGLQRWLTRLGVEYGTLRDCKGTVWVDLDTIPEDFAPRKETAIYDFGYVGDILHLLITVHRQLRYGAPRILSAIAAPQRRTELPPTFFKGRVALKDVTVPDSLCDKHQLVALFEHTICAIFHVLVLTKV